MSERTEEPRILCVDDEPRVLDGLRRTLGMSYEIVTADGGARAVGLLEAGERFALTISDMRMPGMDGAAYLERAAQLDPDMVRLLLTGQADMQAAVRAVNQGRIFRFLTKPCDSEVLQRAVEDALEQRRLLGAEKELLQKTLYGCIKVLTELLSLANPPAFNRACRINRLVQHICQKLNVSDVWQLELVVMLSHLGYMGMAPDLLEKAFAGKPLSSSDQALISGAPRTAAGLMAGIPRLDTVLGIIDRLAEPPPPLDAVDRNGREGRSSWGVHIVLAAERADQLSHAVPLARAISDTMSGERFAPAICDALASAELPNDDKRKVVKIAARELKTGMFLIEDACSVAGMVMAKGGQEVTASVAVLLRRTAERQNLKEPLVVSIRC